MKPSNSSVECGQQTSKQIFAAKWIRVMREICMGFYEAYLRGTVSSRMWLWSVRLVFGRALWAKRQMWKVKSEEASWSHVVNCLEILVRSLGFMGLLVWNHQMFLKGSRWSQPGFLLRLFPNFLLDFAVPSPIFLLALHSLSSVGTALSAAVNQVGSWGWASLPLHPLPHGRPDGICQWLSLA